MVTESASGRCCRTFHTVDHDLDDATFASRWEVEKCHHSQRYSDDEDSENDTQDLDESSLNVNLRYLFSQKDVRRVHSLNHKKVSKKRHGHNRRIVKRYSEKNKWLQRKRGATWQDGSPSLRIAKNYFPHNDPRGLTGVSIISGKELEAHHKLMKVNTLVGINNSNHKGYDVFFEWPELSMGRGRSEKHIVEAILEEAMTYIRQPFMQGLFMGKLKDEGLSKNMIALLRMLFKNESVTEYYLRSLMKYGAFALYDLSEYAVKGSGFGRYKRFCYFRKAIQERERAAAFFYKQINFNDMGCYDPICSAVTMTRRAVSIAIDTCLNNFYQFLEEIKNADFNDVFVRFIECVADEKIIVTNDDMQLFDRVPVNVLVREIAESCKTHCFSLRYHHKKQIRERIGYPFMYI